LSTRKPVSDFNLELELAQTNASCRLSFRFQCDIPTRRMSAPDCLQRESSASDREPAGQSQPLPEFFRVWSPAKSAPTRNAGCHFGRQNLSTVGWCAMRRHDRSSASTGETSRPSGRKSAPGNDLRNGTTPWDAAEDIFWYLILTGGTLFAVTGPIGDEPEIEGQRIRSRRFARKEQPRIT
jgi:hypothetical protein